MSGLTKLQRETLERLVGGDRYGPRCHYQFCDTERSKWVNVWESDKTTVSVATTSALFSAGYYYAGGVTEKGHAALMAARERDTPPPHKESADE